MNEIMNEVQKLYNQKVRQVKFSFKILLIICGFPFPLNLTSDLANKKNPNFFFSIT